MKIKPKQYAVALYETTINANESDIKDILQKFIQTLDKNGHFSLLNKIILQYSNYYNQKQNITDIAITTANDFKNKKTKEDIEKTLKNYLNKKILCTYTTDKNLIAGFKAKTNDYLIDASLKTQLSSLK